MFMVSIKNKTSEMVRLGRGKKNALKELTEFLEKGERIKAITFGPWGGAAFDTAEEKQEIPRELQGKALSFETSKPYMKTWRFNHDDDRLNCHPIVAWTNKRIIFVVTFGGVSWLEGIPIKPTDFKPDAIGY